MISLWISDVPPAMDAARLQSHCRDQAPARDEAGERPDTTIAVSESC
jgi:hypothetical protein